LVNLISIVLKDLHFFAKHGLFKEETQIGNEFAVDVFLSWEAPKEPIAKLEETINYVAVYSVVAEEMAKATLLLETVVMRIADRLKETFPELKKIHISLKKIHPPIPTFTGRVGVEVERVY
jgi:dihydroneopterin aldolase